MAAVLEKPAAAGAEQALALPALRKAVPDLDPKLERLLGAIAQVTTLGKGINKGIRGLDGVFFGVGRGPFDVGWSGRPPAFALFVISEA